MMGVSEQEINLQCDALFKQPVHKFVARQLSLIDAQLSLLIPKLDITIPIIYIKDRLYLIGSKRMSLDIQNKILVIMTSDGYFEKFVEYIVKNHRYHERALFLYMIKSGQSLEWVIDTLFNGRKIKNVLKEYHESSCGDDTSYDSMHY